MSPPKSAEETLIVALDMGDVREARAFQEALELPRAIYKIGLELLFSGGFELIGELSRSGISVFVDAKLLDIGNTVERATARIAGLGAAFLTIHAQGQRTLDAAVRGRGTSPMTLLGVTLLTDAAPESLPAHGIGMSAANLVVYRASLAAEAGLDGVVAAASEASAIRERFGARLSIVVPGIRAARTVADDDQARTATPREAILAGADYLVVGRPILRAHAPADAARAILAEMEEALNDVRSRNPQS